MEIVSLVVGGSVVVNEVNVTTSVTVSDVVAVLKAGIVTTSVISAVLVTCRLILAIASCKSPQRKLTVTGIAVVLTNVSVIVS